MNSSLPIFSIFLKALHLPSKYLFSLLKIGLPIFIVNVVILTSNDIFSRSGIDIYSIGISHFVFYLFYLILLAMTAVGCHRVFLIDSNDVKENNFIKFTTDELKYIGWMVLIGFCVILISMPFLLIGQLVVPFVVSIVAPLVDYFIAEMVGPFVVATKPEAYFYIWQPIYMAIAAITMFLIFMPVFYVFSRWLLVLPSSAIGVHGKSLSWSWGLSSGNGSRLTLLVCFLPFVMDGIFELLPAYDSFIFTLFYGAVWAVMFVIEIGLLSLSYQFLVDKSSELN